MTHAFHSDKWLGYAALGCVAALAVLSRTVGFGSDAGRVVVGLCLFVLGAYSAVRGMFMGGWPSRVCAGLSVLLWVWVVFSIVAAL